MRTDRDGDQEAVRTILSEGFTRTELDQLPFGISVPLRDAIWRCRKNPSPDLNSDALSFIGRNDLAELASKVDPGYYMKPNLRESREGVSCWLFVNPPTLERTELILVPVIIGTYQEARRSFAVRG
jgi:hypothetical protein